jgi:hypothetical protein
MSSGLPVEIAILDISHIQELCNQVDAFKQISRDGKAPSVWPDWTFDTCFRDSKSHDKASSNALFTSLDEATASNEHQTVDPERKFEALRSLCEKLHAILDLLGASPFNNRGDTVPSGQKVQLKNVTHYIALAVQFISLAIQSYVRKSMGNPGFVFLDPPLDEIILEGINFDFPDVKKHKTSFSLAPFRKYFPPPRIVATSQQLSCLSEMVLEKVLVFGPHPGPSDSAQDVHSTLVNLDALWGPIQLILEVSC